MALGQAGKKPQGPKGQTQKPGSNRRPDLPMRTANWPGLPGKTQPRDRSGGVKKLPQSPKQEGL